MKTTVYLRAARSKNGRKAIVEATARPSYRPLHDHQAVALPTVYFALDLVIPDDMFKVAERVVAELTLSAPDESIAAAVREVGA